MPRRPSRRRTNRSRATDIERRLDDLREADVVVERPVMHDARRREYVLLETLETDPDDPPAQRHLLAAETN